MNIVKRKINMAGKRKFTYDFEEILKLVESGLTISQSLKKLNKSKCSFYKWATDDEKLKIFNAKVANRGKYQKFIY